MRRRFALVLFFGVVLLAGSRSEVRAQDGLVLGENTTSLRYVPAPQPPPPKRTTIKQNNERKPSYRRPWASNTRRGRWKAIGLGTAGLAIGFVAHELGHVLVNLGYGRVPEFEGLRYGGIIPFFRISSGVSCNPQGCFDDDGEPIKGGRTRAYLVTSAGFNVQHIVNEVLLSLDPWMQHHRSPLQKGILFFNMSLSIGYALSTWFQIKPPVGDIDGMSRAAQINPNWVALMVMIPTGLDIYRFFMPNSKWAPWVSRSSKVLFLGVSFVF